MKVLVLHWNKLLREVVDALLLETIWSEAGWGSEKLDLVEDVPAHCRGVALDDL